MKRVLSAEETTVPVVETTGGIDIDEIISKLTGYIDSLSFLKNNGDYLNITKLVVSIKV